MNTTSGQLLNADYLSSGSDDDKAEVEREGDKLDELGDSVVDDEWEIRDKGTDIYFDLKKNKTQRDQGSDTGRNKSTVYPNESYNIPIPKGSISQI